MIIYVDSSVLVTLMKRESTTDPVIAYLDDLAEDNHPLVAGQLVETEMRRVASRFGIDQLSVLPVLARMNIVDHTPVDFRQAGLLQSRELGTLDALHLATAIRTQASAMMTFDTRLERSCVALGLPVLDVHRPRTRPSLGEFAH